MNWFRLFALLLFAIVTFTTALAMAPRAEEPPPLRRQDFGADPKWEGRNNRLKPAQPPITRQDFGPSDTNHAQGKRRGEIGGRIQRSRSPASYAKIIPDRSLNDRLTASGRFAVTHDDGGAGILFGWFNNDLSRGWRTNDSLAIRLDGNGNRSFVYFEYGTHTWLTGGKGCFDGDRWQTTESPPLRADGSPHDWSLVYDPEGNKGYGLITFVLDGTEYQLPLDPGHKADGATFDRFGLFNQMTTGSAMEVYFDDLVLDGRPLDGFSPADGWEGRNNREQYVERVVRPYHNFGYSPGTNRAGGQEAGEIGGVLWRGGEAASYADRVGPFSLANELRASGTIAFANAGSDSGVYLGFFDAESQKSKREEKASLPNLLAVYLEGPSRIGHYFRPAYRTAEGRGGAADTGPILRPDGTPHRWSLHYAPGKKDAPGRITVTLDDHTQHLEVPAEMKAAGATFDRFGLFNPQHGGHFVELYLDDLEYFAEPARSER